MAYGNPDVYYQPEKFGLQMIAELDYSNGYYEFDLRVVWRHADGVFYTARDDGYFYPSPFENFERLDQLEVADLNKLAAEIKQELEDAEKYPYSGNNPNLEMEGAQFLDKLRTAGVKEAG